MNSVALVGRLTRDPELRETANTSVATFTLAVDRPWSKEQEEIGADFIRIVVFGKQAHNCNTYLSKGRQAAVTGRIQTGSYTKQDGTKVYTTDVVADRVEFVGGGGQNATHSPAPAKDADVPEGFHAYSEEDDGNIPF